MVIGEKLKKLREATNLSQGELEELTGLLRCYTSRVENGHTVPSVETLEKYARAFKLPLYRLFYEGEKPVKLPSYLKHETRDDSSWGTSGKDLQVFDRLRSLLKHISEGDRKLLLYTARKMAHRPKKRARVSAA